jgi:hypothetical protein
MTKPTILFFARASQTKTCAAFLSDRYDAKFVTLTLSERRSLERRGLTVVGCFEEEFERLPEAPLEPNYLKSSFVADRFLGRFRYPQRRRILAKEKAFWERQLDTHRPVAVMNELVAIEIAEVLLIETRKRNIRYLAAMNTPVDGYFYWLQEPISLSGCHIRAAGPDDDMRRIASSYVETLTAQDYRPFYVLNLAGRRALRPLFAGLAKYMSWRVRRLADWLTGRFRYEVYDDEYAKRIAVYFKGFFHRYEQLSDIPAEAEVLFYPLHQEPEATLNYMSQFYADQVATIENIVRCMTPEQVLVVKEHPVDKGALLRGKFIALRNRCSSVYFLPAEIRGREVLQRAGRVVTLTSNVGWEGGAMGKPVYILGEAFYDHVPGFRTVRDFRELRSLLREPPGPDVRVALDDLERFVANMMAQSYPGIPFPNPKFYTEENLESVVAAITRGAGV